MKHINSYDDLYKDDSDLLTRIKNFIQWGDLPMKRKQQTLHKDFSVMLDWIKEWVENNWEDIDIEFSKYEVTIETKQVTIKIDTQLGYLQWCDQKIWIPTSKAQWLKDWIYEMRQKQMTIPGIHIKNV
jgi:hypothetical protein